MLDVRSKCYAEQAIALLASRKLSYMKVDSNYWELQRLLRKATQPVPT